MTSVLGAQGASAQTTGSESGRPLPRYVSVGDDEVNVRKGPGTEYPINWVYLRRGLPVEVIAEYGEWRRVKDLEGRIGWILVRLLSNSRTLLVRGDGLVDMHSDARVEAPLIARLEPGVQGKVIQCPRPGSYRSDWCYVEVADLRGWLPRERIWGVYEAEEVK
ncbi:MAG: SH3 domain-containing protein [Pseudomonadota bacterium]